MVSEKTPEPDPPQSTELHEPEPPQSTEIHEPAPPQSTEIRDPEPPDWRELELLQRRFMVIVTVVVAAAYLLGITLARGPAEPLMSREAADHFVFLPSLLLDRDLDLANQYALLYGNAHPHGAAADNRAADPASIIPALLWLPGYMCGVVLDRMAAAIGIDSGRDGYGVGALWGAALSSIVLAGLGAELSRRMAAQLRGPEYGLPAALFAWLGTAAVVHTLSSPLHPQSASWFCAALMSWLSWLAFRNEKQWYRWLPAGVAFGLLVGIRPQDAPMALIGAAFFVLAARNGADVQRCAMSVAAGALLGWLPAALAASWLGPAAPAASVAGSGLEIARLRQSLLAVPGGWLTATPIVALALVGLALKSSASRSSVARRVGAVALVAVALLVALDALFPTSGPAGLRFVAATPLLALGLTQLLADADRLTGRRAPGLAVVGALTALNVWLLLR